MLAAYDVSNRQAAALASLRAQIARVKAAKRDLVRSALRARGE
jgi:hypothetical protein